MVIIRKYIIVILAVVLLLLLVIFRLSGWNRFKKSADDLVKSSSDISHIVLLNENPGKLPVVDIRSIEEFNTGHPEGAINIPSEDLLDRKKRVYLDKNRKGIILFSDDNSMLVRTWSLLSQMGYKNIYISGSGIENDEVLKYKFRPDSTIRPE
jgi:rhodanese-related sulfurtransferase